MPAPHEPNSRQLVGIFGIIGWIVLWAVLIASLAGIVGDWPVLAQAPFYLIAGIVWIAPLKPVLQWMETGNFRRPG